MATRHEHEVDRARRDRPAAAQPCRRSAPGEVGIRRSPASRRSPTRAIGDTITAARRPAAEALPGFREVKPMVFAGLYPVDAERVRARCKAALEKLRLNDASFELRARDRVALGFGFRCGFLGLLHMEIVQERLEREFDLDLITTDADAWRTTCVLTDGERDRDRQSRRSCPTRRRSSSIEEPLHPGARSTCRPSTSAACSQLCQERRGIAARHDVARRARVQVALRAAAGRDRARLLRPAEVA